MQLKPPIKDIVGEWIDTENYINNGIFICSLCDHIWTSNNAKFYYNEKCTNIKCNTICNIKYLWYNHMNLSNNIINSSSIKLLPYNQLLNKGIWIKVNDYRSFGIFECNCKKNKSWLSAYANTKYKQQCTNIKCNKLLYPKYIWFNHSNNKSKKNTNNIQHLSALCEGCKNNDCKYINKLVVEIF